MENNLREEILADFFKFHQIKLATKLGIFAIRQIKYL